MVTCTLDSICYNSNSLKGNMFQRNHSALVELGRAANINFQHNLAAINLKQWGDKDIWPHDNKSVAQVQRFYRSSGWSDLLAPMGDLVISSESANLLIPSPVFHKGKQYQVLAGDGNSPNGWKLFRVSHLSIPKVIPYVVGRRVHNLVQPMEEDWLSLDHTMMYQGKERTLVPVPAKYVYQLAKELLMAVGYIHAQGFVLDIQGTEDNPHPIFVSGWPAKPKVTILAGDRTRRCPIGHADQDRDLEHLSVVLASIPRKVETDEDEKADDLLERLADADIMDTFLGNPVFKYEYPPEYQLPEAKDPSIPEKICASLAGVYFPREYYGGNPSEILEVLDLYMIYAYSGIALTNIYNRNRVQQSAVPLQRLGYIRTSMDLYMSQEQQQAWIGTFEATECKSLTHYESDFNKFNKQPLATGDHDYAYNGEQAGWWAHKNKSEFPTVPWQPMLRSLTGKLQLLPSYTQVARWQKEYNREVVITVDSIMIHGMEMDAAAVARIFYNTPLALAVEFGTKEYDPPWLSTADVMVIQDFLEGRIMPFILYTQLSPRAFAALSPGGSFLDLYEYMPARALIDMNFILGQDYQEPVAMLDMLTKPTS